MRISRYAIASLTLALTLSAASLALAAVPTPAQADLNKATAEIKSGDDGQVSTAIVQIRKWVDGGRPVRNVWIDASGKWIVDSDERQMQWFSGTRH